QSPGRDSMEDMTEIPQSLLWSLCDQALFANTFQVAIDFEMIVLEWAYSKGYSRQIREDKNGRPIYPSFGGALYRLKQEPHIPESLITQIEKAWDTRNDLMHDFAWKTLLLGPEYSKEHILREAYVTLHAARCAVRDAWKGVVTD